MTVLNSNGFEKSLCTGSDPFGSLPCLAAAALHQYPIAPLPPPTTRCSVPLMLGAGPSLSPTRPSSPISDQPLLLPKFSSTRVPLASLFFCSTMSPMSYPLHSLSSKFGSASLCQTSHRGLPVQVSRRQTTGELQRRHRLHRRPPRVSPMPPPWQNGTPTLSSCSRHHRTTGSTGVARPLCRSTPWPRVLLVLGRGPGANPARAAGPGLGLGRPHSR
jgi:hypothetical protein